MEIKDNYCGDNDTDPLNVSVHYKKCDSNAEDLITDKLTTLLGEYFAPLKHTVFITDVPPPPPPVVVSESELAEECELLRGQLNSVKEASKKEIGELREEVGRYGCVGFVESFDIIPPPSLLPSPPVLFGSLSSTRVAPYFGAKVPITIPA